MVSYSSLIGLPVLDFLTDEKYGVVKNLLFCSKENKILGLIVNERGIFNSPKYIPLESLQRVGKNSVKIDGAKSIKEIQKDSPLFNVLDNPKECHLDTEVLTIEGEKLGRVRDINFNFEIGTIESYVISDGFIEDLVNGRKVLDADENIRFDENKLIVSQNLKINRLGRGEKDA